MCTAKLEAEGKVIVSHKVKVVQDHVDFDANVTWTFMEYEVHLQEASTPIPQNITFLMVLLDYLLFW